MAGAKTQIVTQTKQGWVFSALSAQGSFPIPSQATKYQNSINLCSTNNVFEIKKYTKRHRNILEIPKWELRDRTGARESENVTNSWLFDIVCLCVFLCVCLCVCVRITQYLSWGKVVRKCFWLSEYTEDIALLLSACEMVKSEGKVFTESFMFQQQHWQFENWKCGNWKIEIFDLWTSCSCLVGQISRVSFPALDQPGCVQQHKTQGSLLSGRKIVHDNNFCSKCIMKDKHSSDLACGKQQKP